MRLQRISMKNFGSFEDADVDLHDISSCVVLGSNGAGKSTLFVDAPLWCLFGQCRVSTDEIMRLGTEEMAVAVEFLLEGIRYRVERKRSRKTKAGKSDLELQVAGADGWVSASGGRLSQTEEKIRVLLGADYALLVSTSIFVQGQADRFSRSTAAERKTILSQILQLDRYPLLKAAAGRRVAAVSQGRTMSLLSLQNATTLAETGALLRATLAGCQGRTKELASERAGAMADRDACLAGEQSAALKLEAVNGHLRELEICDRLLGVLQQKQRAIRESQVRPQRLLLQREALAQATETDARLVSALEIRRADLETARERVTVQAEEERQLNELIKESQVAAAAATWARRDFREACERYDRETADLDRAMANHAQNVTLLAQVPCDEGLQNQCRFTANAIAARETLVLLRPQREARLPVGTLDGDKAPAAWAVCQEVEARQAMWVARELDRTVEGVLARGNTLTRAYGLAFREIQTLEAERKPLADLLTLSGPIQAAEASLLQSTQQLTDLALQEREASGRRAVAQQAIEGAETLQIAQRDLQATRVRLDAELVRLGRLAQDQAMEEGRLTQLLAAAEEAEARIVALKDEAEGLGRELDHWRALEQAHERIPVLILESSIPLLESEANRILEQIASSGMRVRLETQKALKSRDGLAETLDIVVRDVHGERAYENYSGGEKFRLDLALRVGLSKLLSHRAGARIETLVIDEGLGSLDEDGLAQLRECLVALEADFPLVLVVTHVEAMKSTFPSQLVVHKTAEGSRVEVRA